MPNLKHRQEKIQEKRKQTPWRQFVKEICSWQQFTFYKNNGLVSRFPTDRTKNIVDRKVFEDNTAFLNITSQNLFSQFCNLRKVSKLPNLMHFSGSENSEYGDTVVASKNIYLSNCVSFDSDTVLYSVSSRYKTVNVFNSSNIYTNSENIYDSVNIITGYNIFFSENIINSSNIWFSYNMVGCKECFLCNDLENKSYCIKNKQYEIEEYKSKKIILLEQKNKFSSWRPKIIKDSLYIGSTDSDGTFIYNCNDVHNAHTAINVSHARNAFSVTDDDHSSHTYDVFIVGKCKHFYGVVNSGGFSEHIYCSVNIGWSQNIYYSYYLENCSYCLGCIGLKNKQFCILNKQYSKEERYQKVDEIFAQMEKEGILGDFFPGSMNPFYFNDTAAYLIDDSFTKEEVEKEGYLRRDEAIKVDVPEGLELVEIKDLGEYEGWISPPDKRSKGGFDSVGEVTPRPSGDPLSEVSRPSIRGLKKRRIDPAILKKVIKDEKGNYYRIVKMEYDFLMKYGLPLPRLHWLDRIKLGFKFK